MLKVTQVLPEAGSDHRARGWCFVSGWLWTKKTRSLRRGEPKTGPYFVGPLYAWAVDLR